MTTLITTKGEQRIIASPSIEEARKIVGGNLSIICLNEEHILICNEKATVEHEAQNIVASKILTAIKKKPLGISGDVILTEINFLHKYDFDGY